MFIPPPGTNAAAAERAQQQSRGYVLGIILLVLFLSSQDFSPPARRHRVEAAKDIREGMSKHREDVKEKIIVDLSASNERLETENRKLKVAAIGMMAQLRELGHPADASELNISGLGLWTGGDDAGTEDKGGGSQPRKAGPKAKKPTNDGGTGTETERRLS